MVSVPGMYEQYSGYVSVVAEDEKSAEDLAYIKLKRNFPERNRGMWVIERIQRCQ
jgi:hypothetical protein